MARKSTTTALAKFLGEAIGTSIVTQAAGPLITAPLLDMLGMGGGQDQKAIKEAIQEVMVELKKLGEKIDAVKAGIDNVASLSHEISSYQRHEGLSQILRDFNREARVVDTAFMTFSGSVNALAAATAAKDQSRIETALAEVQRRLASPNDTNVSIAMGNIHDLVVARTTFDKSLIDYMVEIMRQRVIDGSRVIMESPVPQGEPGLPNDVRYYPACRIFEQASNHVTAQTATVISIFRSILSIHLKGLTFLMQACAGGPQDKLLAMHIEDVLKEIRAMQGFYAQCLPVINDGLLFSVKQFGKPLSGQATQGWHGNVWGLDLPRELDSKWIVWSGGNSEGILLLEEPWIPNKPRRGINLSSWGGRIESYDNVMVATGSIGWGSDPKQPPPPTPTFHDPQPYALDDLLIDLPSTRAQLDEMLEGKAPKSIYDPFYGNWQYLGSDASISLDFPVEFKFKLILSPPRRWKVSCEEVKYVGRHKVDPALIQATKDRFNNPGGTFRLKDGSLILFREDGTIEGKYKCSYETEMRAGNQEGRILTLSYPAFFEAKSRFQLIP
jgi:hypothetical protein